MAKIKYPATTVWNDYPSRSMEKVANPNARMIALARSFPCVAGAIPDRPWSANALDGWASETPISYGELITVQFLLAVWDPTNEWKCGSFDLMEAMRVWDPTHRTAFLAWATAPWRP